MYEVVYSNQQIRGDIAFLNYLIKKYQVTLIKGTGLQKLIEECEHYVNITEGFSQEELRPLSVLNSLARSLKSLWLKDVDFKSPLGSMNSGNFEYGNPDISKEQFFKDFEFEIFSAGQLCQNKIDVDLPTHTAGEDIIVGDIDIQCKHPSTTNQVDSLMKDFTIRLNSSNRYGVFAMAVEDCFGFGKRNIFEDENDFQNFMKIKSEFAEIELKKIFENRLAKSTRILGLYTTASFFININGEGLRMIRLSNSVFCFRPDRKEIKDEMYKQAYKIVETFNPHPSWLTIEKQKLISIS
nr:hypothetical protein [uncultured Flavobacterium sp.]